MNALHQDVGVPMWAKQDESFISTVNVSFSFISCSANEAYLHSRHKKEKHSLAWRWLACYQTRGVQTDIQSECNFTSKVKLQAAQKCQFLL